MKQKTISIVLAILTAMSGSGAGSAYLTVQLMSEDLQQRVDVNDKSIGKIETDIEWIKDTLKRIESKL